MSFYGCLQGCRRTTPFVLRCARIGTRRVMRPAWRGETLRFVVLARRESTSSKEVSRKQETRRLEEEEEEIVEGGEETTPAKRFQESVAVDPPKWSDALRNRNFGPWAFGSVIASFALYLIYLVFIKDRREELNQIETDLNEVTSHLQRLKEIRMEPDLSDTDIIRVRSFLLSLMIKQRKQDPVKVVNNALSLLGERQLNKREKRLVLGVDEKLRPQIPNDEEEPIPSASTGLSLIKSVPVPEEYLTSRAFDSDASVLWWHKLPYICVLQMKKSRAFFMTAVEGKEDDGFALVGFEDPEEAFHAGGMPVDEQLWGVMSAIKYNNAVPTRPLEDEKHFDLTWVHPKEFNALMESARCYGLVIPAGTLRSALTQRPIPPNQIKGAIDRICAHEKIGAVEARTSQLDAMVDSSDSGEGREDSVVRSLEEDGVDLLQKEETTLDVTDSNGSLQEQEPYNSNGSLQEQEPYNSNGSLQEQEPQDVSVNGRASVTPQEQLFSTSISESSDDHDDDILGELLQNQSVSSENANETMASSSETVPLNGAARSPVDETATADSSDLWWMSLDSVIIPKIKHGNEPGGNVEINISINPDVADFRPILFEDDREAKGFLGILGKLHGPQTLVATVAQSPRQFLDENQKLKRDKIVVLCAGSLLLNRDADRKDVRNAVRMAHVATDIKKGVSSGAGSGTETDLDRRVKKMAEDVVSNFKDRLDSNIRSQSRPGDTNYENPLEGLIHDLEHGGLDDFFGNDSDEGISAKVGEDGQEKPFPGIFDTRNDQEDRPYTKFAAEMTERISKAQENLRNADAPPSVPSSLSNHVHVQDLNISLDALIREKEAEEEKEMQKQSDGVEVVYPDAVQQDKPRATGTKWFRDLNAIYVPTYLTVRGFTTYLVITDQENNGRFVIAFEEKNDAVACKEMMKTWKDKEYIAAGMEVVPPQALLNFCEEFDVEPIVLRRSSTPLSVEMSQSDFLSQVAIIANAQATNYTLFNG